MVLQTKFEDFIQQSENQDRLFELIYGEIVEKLPTQLHAYIIAQFIAHLMAYLKQHPLGWVLPEARYQLPNDEENSRIPDVSFVRSEGRSLIDEGAAPYMPDLAIEVQSPGQSDKFMIDKAQYYLANGSQMVWLVYPRKRLIEVLTLDDRELLDQQDQLSGGDVLPGFTMTVKALFPN